MWAFALLLAILNAGLFIDAAAAPMPTVSRAGSLLSSLTLALWWYWTAAVVGLLPSEVTVDNVKSTVQGMDPYYARDGSTAPMIIMLPRDDEP